MLYKTIVFSVLICAVTLTSDAFSLPLPSAPHYSPKGPKPPNTSKKPTKKPSQTGIEASPTDGGVGGPPAEIQWCYDKQGKRYRCPKSIFSK